LYVSISRPRITKQMRLSACHGQKTRIKGADARQTKDLKAERTFVREHFTSEDNAVRRAFQARFLGDVPGSFILQALFNQPIHRRPPFFLHLPTSRIGIIEIDCLPIKLGCLGNII